MLNDIKIHDIRIGEGPPAERGSKVTVRCSGCLGRSETERDMIITFAIGEWNRIAGLAHGVVGMRVGGLRRVQVSPHTAPPDRVPTAGALPSSALTFEIELLSVD